MSMQLPGRTAILLNGAAIIVAVASVSVAFRSTFFAEAVEPCHERYQMAMRLSLDHDGAARSAEDLQGELSNTDWGLLEGTRVVKLKSGPAKHALEFDLASAPSVARGNSERRAGIGFNWSPQSFGRQEGACLAYSAFVPEGFTFGRGGRLPGLEGTDSEDAGETHAGFSLRYTWTPVGELDIYPMLPDWPEGRTLGGKRGRLVLEPGTWTSIEQEVILNAPGKANGVVRVWKDGHLVMQRTDLTIRKKPTVTVSGVLSEAVSGEPTADEKQSPQKIWLTPFELRWQ